MMNLYLVHDEEYCYHIVVKAQSANEAIDKVKAHIKETKQYGDVWYEPAWIATLCDNNEVLE